MIFEEIIEKYNSFPEVVAIAVGGSGANKHLMFYLILICMFL